MLELVLIREGSGGNSVLVVVPGAMTSPAQAHALLLREVESKFRIYVACGAVPTVSQVCAYADALTVKLEESGIKWATVFGIGAGASAAQALAVRDPKRVRKLVLLDATTRPAPGILDRLIDRLERVLPLGLPLRPLSKAFDSRPILHRIHCPTLVLLSPGAGSYLRDQARVIAAGIPTAWLQTLEDPLSGSSLTTEVEHLMEEFLQVATKKPQKNVAA